MASSEPNKDFMCKECGQEHASQSALDQHWRARHHRKCEVYICPECDCAKTSAGEIVDHLGREHHRHHQDPQPLLKRVPDFRSLARCQKVGCNFSTYSYAALAEHVWIVHSQIPLTPSEPLDKSEEPTRSVRQKATSPSPTPEAELKPPFKTTKQTKSRFHYSRLAFNNET